MRLGKRYSELIRLAVEEALVTDGTWRTARSIWGPYQDCVNVFACNYSLEKYKLLSDIRFMRYRQTCDASMAVCTCSCVYPPEDGRSAPCRYLDLDARPM